MVGMLVLAFSLVSFGLAVCVADSFAKGHMHKKNGDSGKKPVVVCRNILTAGCSRKLIRVIRVNIW